CDRVRVHQEATAVRVEDLDELALGVELRGSVERAPVRTRLVEGEGDELSGQFRLLGLLRLAWGLVCKAQRRAARSGLFLFRAHVQFLKKFFGGRRVRSEEHTSELQSPCNLVC